MATWIDADFVFDDHYAIFSLGKRESYHFDMAALREGKDLARIAAGLQAVVEFCRPDLANCLVSAAQYDMPTQAWRVCVHHPSLPAVPYGNTAEVHALRHPEPATWKDTPEAADAQARADRAFAAQARADQALAARMFELPPDLKPPDVAALVRDIEENFVRPDEAKKRAAAVSRAVRDTPLGPALVAALIDKSPVLAVLLDPANARPGVGRVPFPGGEWQGAAGSVTFGPADLGVFAERRLAAVAKMLAGIAARFGDRDPAAFRFVYIEQARGFYAEEVGPGENGDVLLMADAYFAFEPIREK